MSNSFFAYMYRMKYINRWSLMKNTSEENLSEHSLDCAIIAHALGIIANKIFGKTHINAEKCAVLAMFHDAPEILTGDLPTPVKYFNPETREAYKVVENSAKNTLLDKLSEDMRASYEDLLFPQCEEDNFVHYADKICAYIKCVEELKCGNLEFKVASEQIFTYLNEIDSIEVKYFLDNYLTSFKLTLDELC